VDDDAGLSGQNIDSLVKTALTKLPSKDVYLYSANSPLIYKYTNTSNKLIMLLPHTESKIVGSNGRTAEANTAGELITKGYHVGKKASRIDNVQKNMRPPMRPDIVAADEWISTKRQASMDKNGNINLID